MSMAHCLCGREIVPMTRLMLRLVIALGLALGSASDLLAKVGSHGEARVASTAEGKAQGINAASITLLTESDTRDRLPTRLGTSKELKSVAEAPVPKMRFDHASRREQHGYGWLTALLVTGFFCDGHGTIEHPL